MSQQLCPSTMSCRLPRQAIATQTLQESGDIALQRGMMLMTVVVWGGVGAPILDFFCIPQMLPPLLGT